MVVNGFADRGTEDVFDGTNSRAARRVCPQSLWPLARRKLDRIDSAVEPRDLAVPPRNRLEVLQGNKRGQHSIRINDQYRICFRWSVAGADAVEIADYHD
jgi:proteic killer suppression protein